ncbi:hypothetical protein FOZ61_010002 [Perkinsus olseni]|uniref:Cytochrome b5 heme-binding domain-containing protein n=1 Tax=Perkinsus olseni TaxID=32597 RepID=A0A7J6KXC8_PEROL|nr:hypothetical protein FOZ61_010002 [Perkinsus olseni]
MSDPPKAPEGIRVPPDERPDQTRHSHSGHVSFADRVKEEIDRSQRSSVQSSTAPEPKRLQTPSTPTLPPRRKVKSKNQFAYMRIMADNKPLSFPPDKLTWEEVAQHNSKHDCWTVINGVVYDVTSYLDYHPGGRGELLQGAGKDCTELFNVYHPWVSEEAILRNARLGPVIGGSCPPDMVARARGKLPSRAASGQGSMRPGGDPTKIVSIPVPSPLPSIPECVTLSSPQPSSPATTDESPQQQVPVATLLQRSQPRSKPECSTTHDGTTPPRPKSQPQRPLIPLLFRGSVFFPGMKLFPLQEPNPVSSPATSADPSSNSEEKK